MKKIIFSLLIGLCFCAGVIRADEIEPQARWRLYKGCQEAAKCYAVEIYMPASMNKKDYDALAAGTSQKPPFAFVHNGDALKQYNVKVLKDFKIEVTDKPDLRGNRRMFIIFLPKDFPVAKPTSIIFQNYPITDDDFLLFRTTAVESDFTTTFEFDDYNKIFRQKIVLKDKPFTCDDADTVCDGDRQTYQTRYSTYILTRSTLLENWFKGLAKGNVDLRVEDLNKCLVAIDPKTKQKKGCITFDEWAKEAEKLKRPALDKLDYDELLGVYDYLQANKPNMKPEDAAKLPPPPTKPPTVDDTTKLVNALMNYIFFRRNEFAKAKILSVTDLPKFDIERKDTRVYEDRNTYGPNSLEKFPPILIDYYTERTLPAKFNIQLDFRQPDGNPVPDVPFEVANSFKKTAVEITRVTVNASADTKNVAERDLPDNLDFALLFGSSVVQKEEDVNGVKTKVWKRLTRATIDLRVLPFKNEPFIMGNTYIDWTRFFFDAKVSTGKIDEDTLSLNRVAFGTKFDFRRYATFSKPKIGTNPDYIGFNVQLMQVSDRDFRQLEYKAVGEFTPRFAFLNRIPLKFTNTVNKVIPVEGDKVDFREVPPNRGYKMQPVIGGEIGKTWFRRLPAEVIKPTDYIRRLYVGFDATFYLSSQATLTFTDKYYFNFGKGVDKRENYFKGTLDWGLRKRFGSGDSFFISFEKGNQPPFNTPDVNAFKIGYRFVNPKFSLF